MLNLIDEFNVQFAKTPMAYIALACVAAFVVVRVCSITARAGYGIRIGRDGFSYGPAQNQPLPAKPLQRAKN